MKLQNVAAWVCCAVAAMVFGAGPAAAFTICGNGICESGIPVETNMTCPQDCPAVGDFDGDGVLDPDDNCPFNYNATQANCDQDATGDACDPDNGIWVNGVQDEPCHIDKDTKFLYYNLELYKESQMIDISSCNSPDRWTSYRAKRGSCDFLVPEIDCCMAKIGSQSLCNTGSLWTNSCH